MSMSALKSFQLWAIVPAAGIGSRMLTAKPKQYLQLDGKTILERTLERLQQIPGLDGIVVVLAKNDLYWPAQKIPNSIPVHAIEGGEERYHSVYKALIWLDAHSREEIRVLVHDAARPCVSINDINCLLKTVADNKYGGLLATPVKDTLKRAAENQAYETVERKNLWHAQTPQYFPLQVLKEAMQAAIEKEQAVTDEAQAMELMGMHPCLVVGSEDNIKITRPQDLDLAALVLKHQSNQKGKEQTS